jgi:hypothetical protein
MLRLNERVSLHLQVFRDAGPITTMQHVIHGRVIDTNSAGFVVDGLSSENGQEVALALVFHEQVSQ